jgi:hypothetical protein
LKLDESLFGAAQCRACAPRISKPKSEISDWTGAAFGSERVPVQFEISDFGFEMQDSSNFKISLFDAHNRINQRHVSVDRPS